VSTRIGHAYPRAIAIAAIVLVAAACDAIAPSPTPGAATPGPTVGVFADRPGVAIDGTWTRKGEDWTLTGSVDPQGSPTDVVLEIGPGPETLRQFDAQVPVTKGLTTAGPLTVTTDQIPDIAIICVRFTATNAAGTSSSSPLCFPHDLPTPAPPGEPTVRIDQVAPGANGQWTVTAYIDPMNAPTSVILDVGKGPAGVVRYMSHVQVTSAMTLAGSVQISFTPTDAPTTCVRIVATNSVGRSSTADSCFSPAAGT
jgi:hypothetical protein